MALTNEQYNDIMRSYAADRAANRDILMQRRKEVYTKIPEYRELSTQRSQSVLTALRHRFGETLSRSAEASASLPAPEDAKAWAAAKQELLQKAGLPADYLDPIYTCPYCRDTGYVGRENVAASAKKRSPCSMTSRT